MRIEIRLHRAAKVAGHGTALPDLAENVGQRARTLWNLQNKRGTMKVVPRYGADGDPVLPVRPVVLWRFTVLRWLLSGLFLLRRRRLSLSLLHLLLTLLLLHLLLLVVVLFLHLLQLLLLPLLELLLPLRVGFRRGPLLFPDLLLLDSLPLQILLLA
jgi:hypothetical protein